MADILSDPAFASDSPHHDSPSDPHMNGVNGVSGKDGGAIKLQQAVAAWRGVDFSRRLAGLDVKASDVLEHQKASLTQRKEIATKTKDFRKLDDAKKLAEIKDLLKSYQSYIDLLTDHTKTSSSAFLDLYSSFSDAPDPYPLLEASIDALVVAEDTVPQLKSENSELQRTTRSLSAQLDASEKRFASEKERRIKGDEELSGKVQQIESSWETVMKEKTSNWEAKEKALEEKVENQDRLVAELKASYEVSQRLGEGGPAPETQARSGAAQAELEMMNAELENATARLGEVQARNENLQRELTSAISSAQSATQRPVEDDPAYIRMQTENSTLLRKIDAARRDRDSEKQAGESKARAAQRRLKQLEDDNQRLDQKLQSQSDYSEMKRELDVLRAIEFSATDDLDTSAADSTAPHSLERMLLARNKKLSDDVTTLRISARDSKQQLEALHQGYAALAAELSKSQELSKNLENDLLHLQRECGLSGPPAADAPGSQPAGVPQTLATPTSRTSTDSLHTLALSHTGTLGGGSSSSILPLLTSQRDRFRARNQELEQEVKECGHTISSLRQEVAALQADNLRLFEKSRYISSYPTQGSRLSGQSAGSYLPTSSVEEFGSPPAPGILAGGEYEGLNPFATFRRREGGRAYRRMRVPEKMAYSVSRLLTGSRRSRMLFLIYLVGLHLLVAWMLYVGPAGSTAVYVDAE